MARKAERAVERAESVPGRPTPPDRADGERETGENSFPDSIVSREHDGKSTASLSVRGPVSYSELRRHLRGHLDAVCDSRAPLVVTRHNREPVVMLALSEYESLQETLHLLRDLANAGHLLKSIAEAEADRFFEPPLDE